MDRNNKDNLATTFRALSHPTRLEVLDAVARKTLSPSQFTDAGPGRDALGSVSHHFRALERAGLIEVTAVEQRRGALMRSYSVTTDGQRVNRWLGRLR